MRTLTMIAVVLLGSGCGLGWFEDASGGADNLPTAGAGPYGKPAFDFDTPAEEPYSVVDSAGNLRDPTALARDDGGVRLWFSRTADQVEDASEIWRAELADVLDLPDVPLQVSMTASEDWEQGWVAEPSIARLPSGALVMYYQGGRETRSIGRAESDDGGATWRKHPGNPVITEAVDPAVAILGDQVQLYFTRPGAAGIWRATSADGLAFAVGSEPVLLPRRGDNEAFDRGGVSEPCVLIERSSTGQLHYSMFYSGSDSSSGDDVDVAIGYAGSFDGQVWQRFAGSEPILIAGNPTEHGPTVVLESARGFLFYDQRGAGRQRIGVALHP